LEVKNTHFSPVRVIHPTRWRKKMRILIPSLIALALVPATGEAQTAPKGAIPVSAVQFAPENRAQAKSGPTLEAAAVGIRPAVSKNEAAATQRRSGRRGVNQDVALMIVGGAAIVAGAIIGGDAGTIFMVGGAVIGLWGLYNYLQ
jgi:hypothetical protein